MSKTINFPFLKPQYLVLSYVWPFPLPPPSKNSICSRLGIPLAHHRLWPLTNSLWWPPCVCVCVTCYDLVSHSWCEVVNPQKAQLKPAEEQHEEEVNLATPAADPILKLLFPSLSLFWSLFFDFLIHSWLVVVVILIFSHFSFNISYLISIESFFFLTLSPPCYFLPSEIQDSKKSRCVS